MKKIIIIVLLLFVAVCLFIGYSGMFYSVTLSEREVGPFTMILKEHKGSYFKTGDTFKEVETALKKIMDVEKLKAVGLYYDDPAKVETEKLRSECGYILDKGDLEKIKALKDVFIVKEFKKTLCVTGEFPIKNFFSYMIGPSKAYPKLGEYMDGKKYKSEYGMEIYDMQAKKILYCMPVTGK